MKTMLKKFWNDEAGFVVTVEMILVATVLVIGLVAGLAMLRDAVLAELGDTAQAFGAMDQSYSVGGANYDAVASSAGSDYLDVADGSDQLAADGAPLDGAGAAGIIIAPATADVSAFTAEGA